MSANTCKQVGAGEIVLEMPYDKSVTQQHGFLHGGMVTSGLDSACGFAAFSLMPEDAEVLTAELKTSFMAPARGDRFEFHARVLKPGRTLSFVEADAYAFDGDRKTHIAKMSTTLMCVIGRADVKT